MKAILMVDMPDKCSNCCLADSGASPSDDWNCSVVLTPKNEYMCRKKIKLENIDTIQSWCPLKPLPETKDVGYPNDDYDVGFGDGWDACLKEIIGGIE